MPENSPASVYDRVGSLERMGNDSQLFQEMADFLRRDGQLWLQEFSPALAANDVRRVQYYAHKLKGLISTFGAPRAGRAAAMVEDQARSGNTETLAASVAELESAYRELVAALASRAGEVASP